MIETVAAEEHFITAALVDAETKADTPLNSGFGDAYPNWNPAAALEAFTTALAVEDKRQQMAASLARVTGRQAVAGARYVEYLTAEAKRARYLIEFNGGAEAVKACVDAQVALWREAAAD